MSNTARRRRASTSGASVLGALAVTALLVAACSSVVPAPAPPTSAPLTAGAPPPRAVSTTSVRAFSPYAADGSLHASGDAGRGSCFTHAITVAASRAYRCFAGNEILDPCYAAGAGAASVVCFAGPWAPGERITLTAALPKPTASTVRPRPWALELADGTRCVSVTGTVATVGAIALTYSCGHGSVAGFAQTGRALQTVGYRASSSGALRAEPVAVVWHG